MQRVLPVILLSLSALLSACSDEAASPASLAGSAAGTSDRSVDHFTEVEQWYAGRLQRLTKPDGWLSLVGLHWLESGEHSIGRAADNDIVLAAGPEHFGRLSVSGNQVDFTPANDLAFTVDEADDLGPEAAPRYRLHTDLEPMTSVVASGTVSFLVIDRGGRLGLRVRDSAAAARRDFQGIERYPVDPSWRIVADWVANAEPRQFQIQTVIGTIDPMPSPGYARFVRDGQEFVVHPVIEQGEEDLFIIFADRSNGRETYGAGRFFYAAWPKDGKIVLDFNKAYNPPCTFSEFSTCPLPPPENRMDTLVRAGEKKYQSPGH